MTKKATLEIAACQYFVECQMSIAEIARRLNVSEKTIHNWKKEGEWDKKREFFLKSQYSTNQTLYELVHLVAKKALDDFKSEGAYPDQKTLYFLMNMADKLDKLKNYEDKLSGEKIAEAKQTNAENADNKNNMEDALKKVFDAIIGG